MDLGPALPGWPFCLWQTRRVRARYSAPRRSGPIRPRAGVSGGQRAHRPAFAFAQLVRASRIGPSFRGAKPPLTPQEGCAQQGRRRLGRYSAAPACRPGRLGICRRPGCLRFARCWWVRVWIAPTADAGSTGRLEEGLSRADARQTRAERAEGALPPVTPDPSAFTIRRGGRREGREQGPGKAEGEGRPCVRQRRRGLAPALHPRTRTARASGLKPVLRTLAARNHGLHLGRTPTPQPDAEPPPHAANAARPRTLPKRHAQLWGGRP